jgi:hypothetical protein
MGLNYFRDVEKPGPDICVNLRHLRAISRGTSIAERRARRRFHFLHCLNRIGQHGPTLWSVNAQDGSFAGSVSAEERDHVRNTLNSAEEPAGRAAKPHRFHPTIRSLIRNPHQETTAIPYPLDHTDLDDPATTCILETSLHDSGGRADRESSIWHRVSGGRAVSAARTPARTTPAA